MLVLVEIQFRCQAHQGHLAHKNVELWVRDVRSKWVRRIVRAAHSANRAKRPSNSPNFLAQLPRKAVVKALPRLPSASRYLPPRIRTSNENDAVVPPRQNVDAGHQVKISGGHLRIESAVNRAPSDASTSMCQHPAVHMTRTHRVRDHRRNRPRSGRTSSNDTIPAKSSETPTTNA